MEDAGVGVKKQRQKIAVSFPHRQEMQLVNGVPGERPFFIFREEWFYPAIESMDQVYLTFEASF